MSQWTRNRFIPQLETLEDLRRALDYFYPGRLAVFAAWKSAKLQTTPLRETLDRQSGMYRVAAKISDAQIDDVVASFDGCAQTLANALGDVEAVTQADHGLGHVLSRPQK